MRQLQRKPISFHNDYQILEPRKLLSGNDCGGVIITPTEVITQHDTIPRFGGSPTVTAIAGGEWSSPSIWDTGEVPGNDDIVNIPAELTVVYDVQSELRLDVIEVSGNFEFATEINTSLWLNELFVLPSGTLTIGTSENPVSEFVRTEIVFTDTPDEFGNHFKTGTVDDPGVDPKQYGNGIIVLGTIEVYGNYTTAFVRSTQDIDSGTNVVGVESVDWKTGDQILLPETSQTPNIDDFGELEQTEVFLLDSSNDNSITLSRTTNFNHHGISDNPFDVQRYAHIANLTRNVVFRSENPSGVRGHFMATATAEVNINSATFVGLGRTSADAPVDNTVVDGDSVIYVGENQVGRYSIHLHHLHSETTQLSNSVVTDGLKWGITVHDTNNSLIENNIVYDIDGAGIVTEDGDEIGNAFRDNLVVKINGGHQKDDSRAGVTSEVDSFGNGFKDIGSDGSGFWLRATAGTFDSNYVYDSVGYGFNFNGYYRNDLSVDDVRQIELFAGNETVSSKGGLWFTWSQGQTNIAAHYQRQIFQDFLAWHIDTAGVLAYHDGSLTFDSVTIVGDPIVSSLSEGSNFVPTARTNKGFHFGNPSYENFDIIVSGGGVSGMNFGVVAPVHSGVEGGILTNSTLANYVNIAFINEAELESDLEYSAITFLPSLVTRTGSSMPETVSNVWVEGVGIIEPGELDPDAGSGLPPTLPADFDLRPNGELRVGGGPGMDEVHFSLLGDVLVVMANNAQIEIARELVTSLRFTAYGGNDIFTNETDIPSLVFGGDGDDVITGGLVKDTIIGGNGNDTIYGQAGDDVIYGGSGNDLIFGQQGRDKIRGEADNDEIYGGDGNDLLLLGGDGDDTIQGGIGNDTIIGGFGNDVVVGESGNDAIHGGEGDDLVIGNAGDDTLYGDAGNDIIFGDAGADKLRGGDDDDVLYAELVDILVDGGDGNDEIIYLPPALLHSEPEFQAVDRDNRSDWSGWNEPSSRAIMLQPFDAEETQSPMDLDLEFRTRDFQISRLNYEKSLDVIFAEFESDLDFPFGSEQWRQLWRTLR